MLASRIYNIQRVWSDSKYKQIKGMCSSPKIKAPSSYKDITLEPTVSEIEKY